MAPETLSSHQHAPKCEVWSFAVILWEIATLGRINGTKLLLLGFLISHFCLTGATPYVDVRTRELVQRVQRGMRLKQPTNVRLSLYQVSLLRMFIYLDRKLVIFCDILAVTIIA